MAGNNLLRIYSSTQAYRMKRLTSYIPMSATRCRHSQGNKGPHSDDHEQQQQETERAPSTAEEFRRVAEEKIRQGFASQTVEKTRDGLEEATMGDSNLDHSLKQRFQEPPGGGGGGGGFGNFHKTGHERK